jgi:hypothetical protein
VPTAEGIAKRDFAAGEYEGKYQQISESFAQVEKAIIDLKTSPPQFWQDVRSPITSPESTSCHV